MLQEESPWIGRQRSMPAPGIACVDSMNNWAPESRSSWNGLRDRHVDVETQRKKENGKNTKSAYFLVSVGFDSVEPEPGPCHPNQKRLDSRCHQNLPVVQSSNLQNDSPNLHGISTSPFPATQHRTLNSRLSTKYAFSISCWIGCICSSWKWTNSGPNNCVTRDYTSF